MTLKWHEDRNPYVFNPFGILQLGPFAKPNEIVPQEKKLRTKLKRGSQTLELAGVTLEEHDLGDASKQLRDPKSLAEALLLVHPQTRINARRRKSLIESVLGEDSAAPLADRVKFNHAGGVCWFAPPATEALEQPTWEQIAGSLAAGGGTDLLLDIEFDW